MSEMIEHANIDQARASDPMASVFVSANAGTGKTKVLTDRVLRLLLSGANPDEVLCVTYTRAAAAEMRNRIFKRLADWAIIPAHALGDDLAKMGIATASQIMLRRARSLFAEILDNDDGPRVETVHSFCQSILQRFPIEAGIAPHVKLADDDEQARLKALARTNILQNPSPELVAAILMIAEATSEDQASDIANNFINRATDLGTADCITRVAAHFKDDLGIEDAAVSRARLSKALEAVDIEALRAVSIALAASDKKTQTGRAAKIDVWLAQAASGDDTGRVEKFSYLVEALFSKGKPRASLSNADIRKNFPAVDDIQRKIIAKIEPFIADEAAQLCRDWTLALYLYGTAFQAEYKRLKTQRGLLDYNDLITLTNDLLAKSAASQWVAWKLDNGIGHLLIDEAQDTSPAQWQLLRQLVDAFFDGEGAEPLPRKSPVDGITPPPRSVFAVGDFKQSIYSFQGADPAVMNLNRRDLAHRATAAKADFRDVALSVSFRSTSPVLDLVNRAIEGLPGIEDFAAHKLARDGDGGFVELWPMVTQDDDKAPEMMAAQQVAIEVKSWIGSRRLSTGKFVGAGDILILLRKRDRFFELLLTALQAEGVDVAGADRMKLAEQIEIQDLLALGDVMHLAEDDLQLAAVLKSPLFGMTETQLFELAHNRGNNSLFKKLMGHRGGNDALGAMADQFSDWQEQANYSSVFGFFSYVLTDGGRQKFRQRLGPAVDDTLDHFLGLAQSFALAGGASIIQFLTAIRTGGGEVKRDMDAAGSNEVRIMTIHGSKGLEAPIVILPDMLRGRTKSDALMIADNASTLYWRPPSNGAQPKFIETAKSVARKLRDEEENRLLYVALTRAREGLIIGGWEKSHGVRGLKGSDYALLKKVFGEMGVAPRESDGRIIIASPQMRDMTDDETEVRDLPPVPAIDDRADWLLRTPPPDDYSRRPIRPSQPGLDHVPSSLSNAETAISDTTQIGDAPVGGGDARQIRFSYGNLAHRLLEILPTILPADRAERGAIIAEKITQKITARLNSFPLATVPLLIDKVIQLIEMPVLGKLFSADALVEVPVNGLVHNVGVAGQIDRLYVDESTIILADFKTGKPPNGTVPRPYLEQMALYDALLRQIYPGRQIVCWLVWVDAVYVQEINMADRREALNRLIPPPVS